MSSNNLKQQEECHMLRLVAFWLVAALICVPFMGFYPLLAWCGSTVFVLWFFYQL